MLKTVLPRRVRALRDRMGLSQRAFANWCGVSPATICELEAGQVQPTLTTLIAVCRFLGVSPDALLGWEEYGCGHAITSLTCERCMRRSVRGALHNVGDCIRDMDADGSTSRGIEMIHGLSRRAVGIILTDPHVISVPEYGEEEQSALAAAAGMRIARAGA